MDCIFSLSISVSLKGDFDAGPLAAELLRSAFKQMSVSSSALIEVEIAVVEAVNNVVEHAYGSDATKTLHLGAAILMDTLVIRITDEGRAMPEGLLERVRLPAAPSNDIELHALAERGRGLEVMKQTMNEVSYRRSETANVLTMTKCLRRTEP